MNFTYKEWKKVYHANTKYEEAGMAISVSEETDFKARYISREKERFQNDKKINLSSIKKIYQS